MPGPVTRLMACSPWEWEELPEADRQLADTLPISTLMTPSYSTHPVTQDCECAQDCAPLLALPAAFLAPRCMHELLARARRPAFPRLSLSHGTVLAACSLLAPPRTLCTRSLQGLQQAHVHHRLV